MSVTKRFICFFAVLSCSMLLVEQTVSANLLSNPGFEDTSGAGPGMPATGWTSFAFTTTSSIDTTMPHSGTNAIVEGGGGTPTVGSTGIFQDYVGAAPGEQYTLSVWAKAGALPITTDDTNGGAVMRVVFELLGGADIDATNQLILGPTGGATGSPVTGNGLLSTEYQKFTLVTNPAPAGTQQVKVQLYSRHSDQLIYFDDVELTRIPEPATIGLFLVGGFSLLCGRRQSRDL